MYAVSATFCTCDGLVCLPVRLTFRGRRCLCDEFTALPYSFHARRIIVSNGPARDRHLLARQQSSSVLSIGLRPITATWYWPLTPNTVRLIGTFKRGVPRNKSATFRVSGSADISVLVRRWFASGRRRSPWPSGRGSYCLCVARASESDAQQRSSHARTYRSKPVRLRKPATTSGAASWSESTFRRYWCLSGHGRRMAGLCSGNRGGTGGRLVPGPVPGAGAACRSAGSG